MLIRHRRVDREVTADLRRASGVISITGEPVEDYPGMGVLLDKVNDLLGPPRRVDRDQGSWSCAKDACEYVGLVS